LSNSLIYILLGFLTPAVNFILLPLYTHYLETQDYALITQSTLIQNIFANILGFGVNTAFVRYFYDCYKDPEKLEKLYSTTILSYLLSGSAVIGIFSIIGEWVLGISFSNNIFTYWGYGIFSISTALIYNLQAVSLSYYRNQEKAIHYAMLAVMFFLCVASCIYIGVVVLDFKAKGSIIGRFIGSLIPVVLYLIWYYSKHKIQYSSILNRKLLVYGLPLVPYLLLNVLLTQADKFAIERFFDMSVLGLYGFGFLIASVNEIFINSINSAISPQIYKNMGADTPNSNNTVRKLMSAYVSVGLAVNIGITVAGALGIHYLINEKYKAVAAFFPLLSLSYIPRIYYTAYLMPIFYSKQTKVLPAINLFALFVSFISLVGLAPTIGLYGVCIACILIQFTQMLSAFIFIRFRGIVNSSNSPFLLTTEYIVSGLIFVYITAWYWLTDAADSYRYLWLAPIFIVVFSFLSMRALKLTGIRLNRK